MSPESRDFLTDCFDQADKMPVSKQIQLHLNEYRAGNLRWLLRVIMNGASNYNAKVSGAKVKAEGLMTGDWNGEVLWDLEQAMIEADFPTHANAEDIWPLEGWYDGKKRSELGHSVASCVNCRVNITSEEELRKSPVKGVSFVCPHCYGPLTAE